LASPDRDALMNGRFAPTAAVPGEVGFLRRVQLVIATL